MKAKQVFGIVWRTQKRKIIEPYESSNREAFFFFLPTHNHVLFFILSSGKKRKKKKHSFDNARHLK